MCCTQRHTLSPAWHPRECSKTGLARCRHCYRLSRSLQHGSPLLVLPPASYAQKSVQTLKQQAGHCPEERPSYVSDTTRLLHPDAPTAHTRCYISTVNTVARVYDRSDTLCNYATFDIPGIYGHSSNGPKVTLVLMLASSELISKTGPAHLASYHQP